MKNLIALIHAAACSENSDVFFNTSGGETPGFRPDNAKRSSDAIALQNLQILKLFIA